MNLLGCVKSICRTMISKNEFAPFLTIDSSKTENLSLHQIREIHLIEWSALMKIHLVSSLMRRCCNSSRMPSSALTESPFCCSRMRCSYDSPRLIEGEGAGGGGEVFADLSGFMICNFRKLAMFSCCFLMAASSESRSVSLNAGAGRFWSFDKLLSEIRRHCCVSMDTSSIAFQIFRKSSSRILSFVLIFERIASCFFSIFFNRFMVSKVLIPRNPVIKVRERIIQNFTYSGCQKITI